MPSGINPSLGCSPITGCTSKDYYLPGKGVWAPKPKFGKKATFAAIGGAALAPERVSLGVDFPESFKAGPSGYVDGLGDRAGVDVDMDDLLIIVACFGKTGPPWDPVECEQADVNEDGVVDGADLTILLGAWGTSNPAADLNGDGIVDGADLTILLGAWGPCP